MRIGPGSNFIPLFISHFIHLHLVLIFIPIPPPHPHPYHHPHPHPSQAPPSIIPLHLPLRPSWGSSHNWTSHLRQVPTPRRLRSRHHLPHAQPPTAKATQSNTMLKYSILFQWGWYLGTFLKRVESNSMQRINIGNESNHCFNICVQMVTYWAQIPVFDFHRYVIVPRMTSR